MASAAEKFVATVNGPRPASLGFGGWLLVVVVAALVAAGVTLAILATITRPMPMQPPLATPTEPTPLVPRPLESGEPMYACPMHPHIQSSNANASCPECGMFLEPVESGDRPHDGTDDFRDERGR